MYAATTKCCLACLIALSQSSRTTRHSDSNLHSGRGSAKSGVSVWSSRERSKADGVYRPLGALLLSNQRTPNLPNFRTLGGIAAGNGRVMRFDKLYRCACPANASETDAEIVLHDLGIKTVLDVRGERTALKDVGPRRLAPSTQFLSLLPKGLMAKAISKHLLEHDKRKLAKIVSLGVAEVLSPSSRLRDKFKPKLDRQLAEVLDTFSLPDTYWLMITERGKQMREAAEMCAGGDSLPMLVHCTHGKDRTGVMIAVLLSACGVSEDDIINDYILSHDYGCSVEGRYAMQQALPDRVRFELSDATLDSWCEAPAEVLRDLFSRIRKEYGSVNAYLDSVGIDASMRARLVDQLTQPA